MSSIEIPIRELHARTGHFVRLAARSGDIIITEHGKPAARLSPLSSDNAPDSAPTFAQRRKLRADYRAALAAGKLSFSEDSTPILQETSALRDI